LNGANVLVGKLTSYTSDLEGSNLKILHLATLRGRLLRKETLSITAEDNINRKFLFFNSPVWKLNIFILCAKNASIIVVLQ